MCDLYGPWIQWLFMANTALMGRSLQDICLSDMGHPRLDSIMLLVLRTVVCNGWGTGIVPQVSQESANPIENM
jgi:hypothetical protein